MSTKPVPMGPRLSLLFEQFGDEIHKVPDDAIREVNRLLEYVEGETLIRKLVSFLVNTIKLPEPEPAPEPTSAELEQLIELDHDEDMISIGNTPPPLSDPAPKPEAKRKPRAKKPPADPSV